MTDVWVCGTCHSINRQRSSRCYKCGAEQDVAATGEMATHRQEQAIAIRHVVAYRPAAALGIAAAILLLGLAAVSIAEALDSVRTSPLGAWLSRVVANVPALGGGIPGTSPWRAFVTTLVPGLNLRTVPGTIQDVLYRLDPKAGGFFMVAIAWIGLVGSWIISVVATRYLSLRVVFDIGNATSLDEAVDSLRGLVTAAFVIDILTAVLTALGALVLILVMIRIERRSSARDAEVRVAAGV